MSGKTWDEIRGGLTALALVAAVGLGSISYDIGLPGQSILQSLRFHAAVACLALPLALFLAGARRRAGAMLLVVLASIGLGALPLWELGQRRGPLVAQTPTASLDLLSFNVLAYNDEAGKIAGYLLSETPDVAVILETPGIEPYLPDVASAMPYRVGCERPATCDTSILSRLPLLDGRVIPFGPLGRERLVIAGVEVGGQRINVVATHLTKPYFDGMAYVELRQLVRELANLDGPVVLSGDFNSAPWADALVELVRSADLVPPPSAPSTWPVEAGALGIPIDNMFTRGQAVIGAIEALPNAYGSNHRGLRARIDLVPTP